MERVPQIIEGFTHTEYLTVFSAIIFGYVGAEYFQGWGSLIRNRKNVKVYWQHTLWTIFAFTLFIQNWWGMWPRVAYINENIFYFLYSLVPIFLFYMISVILFPDVKKEDSMVKMEDYFYENSRYLFGLFSLYFVFTIVSSFVYPDIGNVLFQNILRTIGVLLAAGAAYFHQNKIIHLIFLIIGYAALVLFFFALPS